MLRISPIRLRVASPFCSPFLSKQPTLPYCVVVPAIRGQDVVYEPATPDAGPDVHDFTHPGDFNLDDKGFERENISESWEPWENRLQGIRIRSRISG